MFKALLVVLCVAGHITASYQNLQLRLEKRNVLWIFRRIAFVLDGSGGPDQQKAEELSYNTKWDLFGWYYDHIYSTDAKLQFKYYLDGQEPAADQVHSNANAANTAEAADAPKNLEAPNEGAENAADKAEKHNIQHSPDTESYDKESGTLVFRPYDVTEICGGKLAASAIVERLHYHDDKFAVEVKIKCGNDAQAGEAQPHHNAARAEDQPQNEAVQAEEQPHNIQEAGESAAVPQNHGGDLRERLGRAFRRKFNLPDHDHAKAGAASELEEVTAYDEDDDDESDDEEIVEEEEEEEDKKGDEKGGEEKDVEDNGGDEKVDEEQVKAQSQLVV